MGDPMKKGLAFAILERGKPGANDASAKDEEESSESEADVGKETAMDDFIKAVHGKDTGKALEAFESLMEQC